MQSNQLRQLMLTCQNVYNKSEQSDVPLMMYNINQYWKKSEVSDLKYKCSVVLGHVEIVHKVVKCA